MGELQGGINWDIPQFIDDTTTEAGASPKAGALPITDTIKWEPLNRSYEGCKWFMVVFKPYNKPYLKDPEWYYNYAVDKGRKWAYRLGKAFYVTREIDATKVHVNVLICSGSDLMRYHDKTVYNKYRLHVSELDTLGDRQRVLAYITKESKDRSFKLYSDYYATK